MLPALTLRSEDAALLVRLIYTNQGQAEFRYVPKRFQVIMPVGVRDARVRLDLPEGWRAVPDPEQPLANEDAPVSWTVIPGGQPDDFEAKIVARLSNAAGPVVRMATTLAIEIQGYSQFDPARYGLPWANTANELGKIRPGAGIFERTFDASFLPASFFTGLYHVIVFIGAGPGEYQGGLCTGMARMALEQSLASRQGMNAAGHDEIILLHGRQLTDRALLASSPWFFMPSPRRAFARFKANILATGRSDMCFDIGVPRPWRRDIARALVQQGHTVVPYAFHQASREQAEVLIYDPNHPVESRAGQIRIRFDFRNDTYEYHPWATRDDRSTTVIAAPQAAYRDGRTAFLASAASLFLFPRSITQSRLALARWGLLVLSLTAAMLGGLGFVHRRRRQLAGRVS